LNLRILVRRIIQALFRTSKISFLRFSIGLFVVLLCITSVLFIFRKEIISSQLINKLRKKGLDLSYSNLNIDGFDKLKFENLLIKNSGYSGDYLFKSEIVELDINIWKSVFGTISFNDLKIGNSSLHLVDSSNISNYKTYGEGNSTAKNQKKSFTQTFNYYLSFLPKNMVIDNFEFSFKDSIVCQKMKVLHVIKMNDSFDIQFYKLDVQGSISAETKKFKLFISPRNNEAIKWKDLSLTIPKASLEILPFEQDDISFGCILNFKSEEFEFSHPKISDQTIDLQKLKTKLTLLIDGDKFKIDSNSIISLGNLVFNISGAFTNKVNPKYELSIHVPKSNVANLFTTLPKGLFPYSSTIKSVGKWEYNFNVNLDSENLDSTIFESEIWLDSDFKILNWGKTEPQKYLHEFDYQTQFSGGKVYNFRVGHGNPDYVKLENISPLLVKAILTSEDPSYFYHNGFYKSAFREALIENYQKKKIVRGGSTISMQLVKNIYLSHNKTLARKLEEIIIVWLLENKRAISKERMLEIYLNIIEWGPGIFGVGQASWFYFQKNASELSMEESIYLASLIPAPSKSKWSIDDNGKVNPKWTRYFKLANRIRNIDGTLIDTTHVNVLKIHRDAVTNLRKPMSK